MTVPPWEFFSRVFPDIEFGEGRRDSARLRSVAGAFSWPVRGWDGSSTRLTNALAIGADASHGTGDDVNAVVASLLVAADLGMMDWDGNAVLMTVSTEATQSPAPE